MARKEVVELIGVAGAAYLLVSSMEFQEREGELVAIVSNEDLGRLTKVMTDLKAALESNGVKINKLDIAS